VSQLIQVIPINLNIFHVSHEFHRPSSIETVAGECEGLCMYDVSHVRYFQQLQRQNNNGDLRLVNLRSLVAKSNETKAMQVHDTAKLAIILCSDPILF
jgi:hypothetical protein